MAGASVWNTPTVDAKRRLLYFTTGKTRWVTQVLEGDIWSGGCEPTLGGRPDNPGCADPVGPDFDFAASPVLTTVGGKDYLIATQKSGLGFAFDPDNGKQLWSYRWGEGAAAGGVYGTATDGERVWFTPPGDLLCNAGPSCTPVQAAAVTAIPGVVFSGSWDGGLRAHDSKTGEILWVLDTNKEFPAVNGVKANGGSMDGAGPIIVNGMLYVVAGNGGPLGSAGNVVLAFALECRDSKRDAIAFPTWGPSNRELPRIRPRTGAWYRRPAQRPAS